MPLFTGVIPETGIHGIPRERQYDAVASDRRAGRGGDSARFVALEDGSLLIEEGEGDLTALADAIEHEIARPYRATAVRRGETTWAIAAHRLRVIELPEPGGDEIELVAEGRGEDAGRGREPLVSGRCRSSSSWPTATRSYAQPAWTAPSGRFVSIRSR